MKTNIHTNSLHTSLNAHPNDHTEFAHLEQRYGITSDQIQRAIAVVGKNPEKVEDYLRGKLFSFLAYTHN